MVRGGARHTKWLKSRVSPHVQRMQVSALSRYASCSAEAGCVERQRPRQLPARATRSLPRLLRVLAADGRGD